MPLRLPLLAAAAALLAGCFQVDAVLTVRPDGSGELREAVSADGLMAVGLLQNAAALHPGDPAQRQQGAFVRSVEREVRPGGARVVVTYDVPDVTALVYEVGDAVDPGALAGELGAPPQDAEAEHGGEPYRFAFTPGQGGAPAELRVVTPAPRLDAPDADNPFLGGDAERTPLQTFETSMALFGRLAMRFAVRVDGEFVGADGGWRSGDEVLLSEVDFGTFLPHLYTLQGSVGDDAMAALAADLQGGADLPGYRAVGAGETTIRLR